MAATNHTTNYNLPVFVNDDIPTWLGDWNTAMQDIDTALKNIADSSGSDVDKAYVDEQIDTVNEAISGLNTTVTNMGKTVTQIQTSLNTLIKNAVTWGTSNTGITAKQYEQLKVQASN